MLIDPCVEKIKFDAEVSRLRANEARLRGMGVWLARASAPYIDLLLIPRHLARFGMPVPSTGAIVVPGQIQVHEFDLTSLAGRPIGLRLDLSGYDLRAPSVAFVDPWEWNPLAFDALPLGMLTDDPAKPQQVVLDQHPVTRQPFVCLRGIREYHDHPQHDGDDWMLYRSGLNVLVLIEHLARVLVFSVRPTLIPLSSATRAGGSMTLNLVTNWKPEVGK